MRHALTQVSNTSDVRATVQVARRGAVARVEARAFDEEQEQELDIGVLYSIVVCVYARHDLRL